MGMAVGAALKKIAVALLTDRKVLKTIGMTLLVLASQNIEDFLIPSIREFTKPLFSIPTHQFLFNPGMVNDKEYIDALQVGQAEYDLIHNSQRGVCLYRCGNERYLLQVLAPDHKKVLFGTEGGR